MLAPRARLSPPPPPREIPADVAAEARLLAALADIPAVARGWVFGGAGGGGAAGGGGGGSATLLVEWGQRDVPANRSRRYTTAHALVRGDRLGLLLPPPPPPASVAGDVVLSSPSPSGARQLVVRAPPPAVPTKANRPADAPLSVEIWGNGRCLLELSVPPSVHGPVYGDGAWFGLGGASWSADEDRVAYVAEAPPAATTPEWGRELSTATAADGAAPRQWRGLAPFSDDWGEQLAGCRAPAVFVLDVAAAAVVGVPLPPSDGTDDPPHAAGQPALAPDGATVVYAAWPARPSPRAVTGGGAFPARALGRERLGITHCTNRPCALWAAPVPAVGGGADTNDGDSDSDRPGAGGQGGRVQAGEGVGGGGSASSPPACLTPALLSALSPRFAPDGRSLAFLSHDAAAASGVHCATAALHVLPWCAEDGAPAGPPRAAVPVVAAPPAPDAFPGLYATALPDRPWVDGSTIALTSQWGATADVVLVDVATGRVARVADRDAFPGAWSFVGAGAGWLAAAVSGPAAPPDVVVLDTAAAPPRWRRAARADGAPPLLRAPAAAALDGVTTVVLDVPSADGHPVQAVAVLPPGVVAGGRGGKAAPPALLIPHGGPHAAHTDAWTLATALFAGLGYTCLLVNFRGSLGYGEAALQSLPGRIGDADVDDCVRALDAAVAARVADPARVAAVGGSHGGFLVGNLVGRHPHRFKAGILRNPVLDLSLMVAISDIPDWCWVEAFGPAAGAARARATPTADDVARFREVSPVSSAAHVTAPLLLLLGGRDRRVPLEDAQRYVAALRARRGAPPTRVLVFPNDAHALDSPQTEFEAWLNAAAWLKEHVK